MGLFDLGAFQQRLGQGQGGQGPVQQPGQIRGWGQTDAGSMTSSPLASAFGQVGGYGSGYRPGQYLGGQMDQFRMASGMGAAAPVSAAAGVTGGTGSTNAGPDNPANRPPAAQTPTKPADYSQFPPVVQAIMANTGGNIDLETAMLLGSYLESSWSNTAVGDSGNSFGPFQINLPSHPGVTAAQAENPQWAEQYMQGSYQSALSQVDPSLWQTNPTMAAEEVAALAERPSHPGGAQNQAYYLQGRDVAGAYGQAQGVFAGAGTGTGTGGAGGGTSPGTDLATQLAQGTITPAAAAAQQQQQAINQQIGLAGAQRQFGTTEANQAFQNAMAQLGIQSSQLGLQGERLGINQGDITFNQRILGEQQSLANQLWGAQNQNLEANFGLTQQQQEQARQQEALNEKEARAGLDSSAAAGGATVTKGYGEQVGFQNTQNSIRNQQMALSEAQTRQQHDYQKQTQGISQQQGRESFEQQLHGIGDSQKQHDIAEKQLGLMSDQLGISKTQIQQQLQNTLAQLGISDALTVNQLMQQKAAIDQGMFSPIAGLLQQIYGMSGLQIPTASPVGGVGGGTNYGFGF